MENVENLAEEFTLGCALLVDGWMMLWVGKLEVEPLPVRVGEVGLEVVATITEQRLVGLVLHSLVDDVRVLARSGDELWAWEEGSKVDIANSRGSGLADLGRAGDEALTRRGLFTVSMKSYVRQRRHLQNRRCSWTDA